MYWFYRCRSYAIAALESEAPMPLYAPIRPKTSQPNFPQIGPSLYELIMNTGVFSIIMKSQIAKLTTNILEGVLKLLVLK